MYIHGLYRLHGLGDSSSGFSYLFKQLQSVHFRHTRVVLPNAPERTITVNSGMTMQGWYDIYALGMDRQNTNPLTRKEDESGIQQSYQQLTELIEYESTLVPSNKIVVGGFSQGAAISLYTTLQYTKPLAAVVLCSGYLLLPNKLSSIICDQAKSQSYLSTHGTGDDVVPYIWAKKGYDICVEHGIKMEHLAETGIGHTMSETGLQKVTTFMYDRLK